MKWWPRGRNGSWRPRTRRTPARAPGPAPIWPRGITARGNWQWRFTAAELSSLSGEKSAKLSHWIKLYDRTGDRPLRDYSEPPEH